jgi:DNA-binding beta-propeller fold protein YncE
MPDMDDTTLLRELLERATVSEPPIGPMPQNALRQGIGLRRRRARMIATTAAVVGIICVAALAMTGVIANRTAAPARIPATVYVLGGTQTLGTVTPISTTTNQRGRPIVFQTGYGPGIGTQLATTPNGKTVWVADGSDYVTSISTATNRAGKPVRVVYLPGEGTSQVLASPDGKTVYVLDSTGAVTPISTATHRAGKPIELGQGGYAQMAITPDGKTLYVAMLAAPGVVPSYIIVINTAGNRISKRIRLATAATAIVITPNGKTAYVIGQSLKQPGHSTLKDRPILITPIAIATNRPEETITVGQGLIGTDTPVAMTANGRTLYIPHATSDLPGSAPSGVIPFSTATNTPGKPIGFGAASIMGIAITPDGSTIYVLSQPAGQQEGLGVSGDDGTPPCTGPPGNVTPIATATNTVGRPINVGCSPFAAAFTPDGRTLYVGGQSGTVTPITTATGLAGKPIKVEGPQEILIVPTPG